MHPVTPPPTDRAVPASGDADLLTTTDLAVGGMTCAACVARVEKRLHRIEGVTCGVNLATGRARVVHPAYVPVADLTAAVRRAGYTAELGASASPLPGRQRLHHAHGALAMVYTSVIMPMGAGTSGAAHARHPTDTGVPLLTGVLLAYFGCYALFAGAALAPRGPADAAGAAHPGVLLGRACRVVMAVAMLTMLAAL